MLRARIAAFLLTLVFATGCSRPHNAPAVPGTLIIAQIQEPRSLNPLFLDGYVASVINGLVYSTLTTYDTQGNMRPQIATVVPTLRNHGISQDGRHITFHLRKDVRWQDGAPITARDVVFTFHAIMDPRNATLSRYGYDAVSDVQAVGPYEVRLTLRRPLAEIISYFFGGDSNYPILPAHLLARYASLNSVLFNAMPVGSGPYKVQTWQRGDRITFIANDSYFLGKPAISRIDLKFVPNTQTIINELRTGEVNADFFADVSHIAELRALRQHRVVQTPVAEFGAFLFNTQDAVTGNPAVRRAIAFSIDRRSIAKKIFKDVYDPLTGMQGLFTWAFDPAAETIRYDPAQARRILEGDGWHLRSDGVRVKDGATLDVSVLAVAGSAASSSLETQLTSYAAAIGVRLHVRMLTSYLYTDPSGPLYRGSFQGAVSTWQSAADPDAAWIIGCDQRAPHGFNFARYCDPQTQRWLDDGSRTFDRARRRADYQNIQRRLAQQVPIFFLYQIKEVDAIPLWLQGYTPSLYTSPYTYAYAWRIAR